MQQYGNTTTFNIEKVLYQNAIDSLYFKNNCVKLTAFEELVDEVYYKVDNVEPWMGGNARGATSAYCLLLRLGQLKPTDEQVQQLLDHTDSPFIRAIGFLYLRYVLDPRTIWDWLQYYIKDHEEFQPSGEVGTSVTIGAYARDIFLDQYYFETIFPRIPKPVADDLAAKLTAAGLPGKAVGNGGQGGPDRRGIEEANRRPASVKASLSVAMGQRAPNRAAGREIGRGLGSSLHAALPQGASSPRPDRERNGRDHRGGSRDREQDRERERERERERSRLSDCDAARRDRGHSRDRDRDRARSRDHDARDYDRRADDRHRDRGRSSSRADDYDRRDRDRDRHRERSRRDGYDRHRDPSRRERDDRGRGELQGHSRHRSRSRERR